MNLIAHVRSDVIAESNVRVYAMLPESKTIYEIKMSHALALNRACTELDCPKAI